VPASIQQMWQREAPLDGRSQVARSCVDVGSFHTRLVERFMILTASVGNILDTPSCVRIYVYNLCIYLAMWIEPMNMLSAASAGPE
jgi:hypothetical protein